MGNLVARTENLATEPIDGGLLVYDLISNDVHWLDAVATDVWRLADGTRTIDEIALAGGVRVSDARVGLEKLVDLGLAADVAPDGLTRRLMIRKVAVTAGVAAVAGPIISSVVAPTAAFANTATCDVTQCSGTGTTSGGAKSTADHVCSTNANCVSTSTCTCTSSGSKGSFTCTGTCVY